MTSIKIFFAAVLITLCGASVYGGTEGDDASKNPENSNFYFGQLCEKMRAEGLRVGYIGINRFPHDHSLNIVGGNFSWTKENFISNINKLPNIETPVEFREGLLIIQHKDAGSLIKGSILSKNIPSFRFEGGSLHAALGELKQATGLSILIMPHMAEKFNTSAIAPFKSVNVTALDILKKLLTDQFPSGWEVQLFANEKEGCSSASIIAY